MSPPSKARERGLKAKRSKKAGLEPGTPVYVGEHGHVKTRVRLMEFSPVGPMTTKEISIGEMSSESVKDVVRWYDVVGLSDVDAIQEIGKVFKLHPLVVEDILNTDQRPKAEEGGHFIAIFMRMVQIMDRKNIKLEHVCLAWGPGWVLLFQEDEGDLFEFIRNRIRTGQGRICTSGADFLAYNLIDTMVDHYFFILESKIEEIEILEERLLNSNIPISRGEIYSLRREMLLARRQIWPMREVISQLVRMETPLIHEQTRFYFRDVYDHCIEVMDSIETLRETLASLAEVQISTLSHRLNSVMMVLTIIATIFMPLTFISSIYGMNFKHMPELEWEYGYPVALALMAGVAGSMLIWFRKKKWV